MRTITNTGDPIVDLEGNPLANCKIEFKLVNGESPYNFTSVAFVSATGERIGLHEKSVLTDANGIFSITLYCNDELTSPTASATMYYCKVNNSLYSVFYASLPTGVGDLSFKDFYNNSVPLTPGEIVTYENQVNKNASGGYVGLDGFKIQIKNALGTFTSLIQNANTAIRTYTLPNKTGTVALIGDAINDVLTGFTSGAGTITASDTILTAIQKLDANTPNVMSATLTGYTGDEDGILSASDTVLQAFGNLAQELAYKDNEPESSTVTTDTTLNTYSNLVYLVSGNSITLTIPDSATLPSGWHCTIVNQNSDSSVTAHADGSATQPVSEKYARVVMTSTDTLNGLTNQINGGALVIPPKQCIDVYYVATGEFYCVPSTKVGWKDMPTEPKSLGVNANDPVETNIDASFMRALEFTNATAGNEKEVYFRLHVNHDYVKGSKLWLHIHFNAGNTTSTNTVRFGFQYDAVKGHGQQTLSTTGTTVYINTALNGTAYTDYVAELSDTDAVPATDLEPDTLVHVRLFRDSAHASDTLTTSVWLEVVDAHYLSYDMGTTPLKAPPFYV